jgi:hypothetical protein
MNKGTYIWVAAVVDEYLEKEQLLRDRLTARNDRIRELKRQVREERQLSKDRSADEELGRLSNRSAEGELGKQGQGQQRADRLRLPSAADQ